MTTDELEIQTAPEPLTLREQLRDLKVMDLTSLLWKLLLATLLLAAALALPAIVGVLAMSTYLKR